MTIDEAKALLASHDLEVTVPAAGEVYGEQAAARMQYRLAAAAYLLGSAICLGHQRAARYLAQSLVYEKMADEQSSAGKEGEHAV